MTNQIGDESIYLRIMERIEIENFAKISESYRRREAMIKTAQLIKELNVRADDLDKNPWLLNVRNKVKSLCIP